MINQSIRKTLLTTTYYLVCITCASGQSWKWAEGSASTNDGATRDFYNRGASLSWETFMGDWVDQDGVPYGSTAFAETTIIDNDSNQVISFDITSLTNEWTSGTRLNNGILLQHDRGGPFDFRSREHGIANERPKLLILTNDVMYSLEPEADTFLSSSTFTSQGKDEHFRLRNGASTPLLRFDLSAFDGQVISNAELQLTSYAQFGGGSAVVSLFSVPANDTANDDPTLGIATAFDNDADLASHPDVFFATGFEEGGPDDLESWKDEWSAIGGNVGLVSGADPQGFSPLNGRALRMFFGTDEFYGMNIRYRFQDKHGAEPEEIYFRYYLRLGENWDQSIQGGKLPGIAGTYGRAGWGGRRPSETDSSRFGWSARGLFNLTIPEDNNPLGGATPIGSYVYHLDQASQFGSSEIWNQSPGAYLDKNRWYCIEHRVKLNTVGQADGMLQGWVDGQMVYERSDFRFRSVDTLKIQEIWMNFYHGGTIPSPYQQHAYVDHVVVAQSYIGPMGAPTETGMSFSEWLSSYDPTLAGDDVLATADPNENGLSNLLEYALDSPSPTAAPLSVSPKGTFLSDDTGDWAIYEWRENSRSEDLSYTVKSSNNLSSWTPLVVDGADVLEVTVNDNIDGDGSARLKQTRVKLNSSDPIFLRLEVILDPG